MSTESIAGAALLARLDALGEGAGWVVVGVSREARPIRARRFGSGSAPPLLLMGGIHGNEPSSSEALLELAEVAPAALAGGPHPVWVLPGLNPDGLLRDAKDSAAGVDLNRNFPARNFSRQHPPGYDPGPAPASEPETAAFVGLVEREAPRAVVAVHAPFACINYDGPAEAWAARVAGACGWPARADIGYPTPGSLGSWLGVERGLPVLTLELPPGPYPGFRGPAQRALGEALAYWQEGGSAGQIATRE